MCFMPVIMPCKITICLGKDFGLMRLTGFVIKILPKHSDIELWNTFSIRQVTFCNECPILNDFKFFTFTKLT